MARKLLVAIGLMVCGITFTGIPAEAQLAWYGFSNLCFFGQWKGGSEGKVDIRISNIDSQARCENVSGGGQDFCQPGSGNFVSEILIETFATASEKEKGVFVVAGCLDPDLDALAGEGACVGQNKVYILNSAHLLSFDTKYVRSGKNGQPILHGTQTGCTWQGTFFEDTCTTSPSSFDGLNSDPNAADFECLTIETKK